MLRKVFKTGNSVVVSLPKEGLELLGVKEGANISLTLDQERRQIVISPIDSLLSEVGVDAKFARQVREFIEQYRPALESLSRQ